MRKTLSVIALALLHYYPFYDQSCSFNVQIIIHLMYVPRYMALSQNVHLAYV